MGMLDRNLTIKREHEQGVSQRELARRYGLSPARVHQITSGSKIQKFYPATYDARRIKRTITSIQSRMGRMVVDLHTMASEVADLERLLDATLSSPEVTKTGDQ